MNSLSRIGARLLFGAVAGGGLAGCAIAPYAGQTGALTSATSGFKALETASSPIAEANATLAQVLFLKAMSNGATPRLSVDCWTLVDAQSRKVNAAARGSAADEAQAFAALGSIPACGPIARPEAQPTEAASAPPPQPVITALDGYLDGLNAIVSAADQHAVGEAAEGLTGSIKGLVLAADPNAQIPEAASDVIRKLVKLHLEQARYAALRSVVLKVDPYLNAAARPLTSALRVRQGYWATEVAFDAAEGMTLMNGMLEKEQANPQLQLELYGRFAPILADFAREQAASRQDPAGAVSAVIEAHHALAAALKTHNGQIAGAMTSMRDLATSAEALASPAS